MKRPSCSVLKIQLLLSGLLFAAALWQLNLHPQEFQRWQQQYSRCYATQCAAYASCSDCIPTPPGREVCYG